MSIAGEGLLRQTAAHSFDIRRISVTRGYALIADKLFPILNGHFHPRCRTRKLRAPADMRGSAFDVGDSMRWIGIVVSSLGIAGEIWAAVSLGASYVRHSE